MKSRADLVNRLAKDTKKESAPPLFDFDMLRHPGMRMLIPDQVIANICSVVADIKLDNQKGKEYRRQYFKEQLAPYGFVRLGGGTNREVFKHLDDQSVVLKIAIDSLARNNNLAELVKQEWIKPFCTKMFDVTPCGTMGLMERGDPIINRIQRLNAVDGIYRVMEYCNDKGYVVGDGGGEYFMNYVIRPGFGPVLCDFTSVYKLDFAKLRCRRIDNRTGKICGGSIDYALPAMSKIICEKCGAVYSALDLAKEVESMQQLIQLTRSDEIMEVKVIGSNGEVLVHSKKSTDVIKHDERVKAKQSHYGSEIKVQLSFTEIKDDGTTVERNQVNGVEKAQTVTPPNQIVVNMNEPVKEEKEIKVRVGEPSSKNYDEPKVINVNLNEGESVSASVEEPKQEQVSYVKVQTSVSTNAMKPHEEVKEEPKEEIATVEVKEPEIVEEPEVEEVQTPEPSSNEENTALHEILEKTREELKEHESKITINGKPLDPSQFEEEPKVEVKVEEEKSPYDEYEGHKYEDNPRLQRMPKSKSKMDMGLF